MTRGPSLRGAAFSREEPATWQDVAIHDPWIASFLAMTDLDLCRASLESMKFSVFPAGALINLGAKG